MPILAPSQGKQGIKTQQGLDAGLHYGTALTHAGLICLQVFMLVGTIDNARGHAFQHTIGIMLCLHLHLTVAVEKD